MKHDISQFIKALPGLLPALKVSGVRANDRAGMGRGADFVVNVRTPLGRVRELAVGVRATASPSRIREALRALKAAPERLRRPGRRIARYPVFASTFLSPRVREICREEDVGYVDLAGNCLLRFDDCYVEKVVEKNPFPHRGRPPSLFGPVSGRLLRALLEEPARTWQVSELARTAQVSLGQTSNVTRRLIEEEYAVREQRRLRLTRPAQLLDAWRERATPSTHTPRAYYSFERDPDRLIARIAKCAAAHRLRYALTSFAAAARVAPFVRGIGAVQWYVESVSDVERWVKALDLRPVESGPNAVLVIPSDPGVLYRSRVVQGVTLVGHVQLYLDLYSDPARGREQADFLRRKKLNF